MRRLTAILFLSGTIYCSQVQTQNTDLTSSELDCSDSNQSLHIQLKTQCPKLYKTLKQNGLMATLEEPLPKQLSLTQLRMLQTATKLTNNVEILDELELNALLASIYTEKKPDNTVEWWKQFLNWLSGFKPEKYETEFNWLVKLLEAITPSEQTARYMMYATFALIILLAIGLVIWELYLSGVFYRKRRKNKKQLQQASNSIHPSSKHLSFEEIKQLAPSVQSVALLKSMISQLMDKEILPKNSALTNLEFKQCLQTTHSSNSKPFSLLLNIVEPILYGDENPSEQAIKQSWQHAEQILER